MERQDVLRKLQKLRVMADRTPGPEGLAAARLFDALISKYDIDPALVDAEEKRDFRLNAPQSVQRWAIQIGQSFGLRFFHYKRNRKEVFVTATETEYRILCDSVMVLKKIYAAKKKEFTAKLNGYMYGYVQTTYPTDDKVLCPKCNSEMIYSKSDRRYFCKDCGYVGKKLRKTNIDFEEMAKGARDSGRLITA